MKNKITFALIIAILLFSQCKKQGDDFRTPDLVIQSNQPLINGAIINNWFATNPVAKYITLDWSKARQTTINGKKIVRVPTLNVNKIPQDGTSKLSVTGDGANELTSNYFTEHPPELFFIQDTKSAHPDSLLTYMLNFVPTNKSIDFGQNGIWTGKLYDWDLKSTSLHVQELVKNSVAKKYVLSYEKPKESSVKGIATNSFWDWLGDVFGAIGDFFNYVGYSLGIPGTTRIMFDDSSPTNYYIYTREWGFDFGGGGSSDGGGGDTNYEYPPQDIYNPYIPGFGDVRPPDWGPYFDPNYVEPAEVVMADNIQDVDDNSSYGDYDQTQYTQYQDQTPWPNIPSFISTSDFVPYYKGSNCFHLAQELIAKYGFKVSAKDAPNQTIQVYKESGGADKTKAIDAVSYLISALSRHIPVVVGVDAFTGNVAKANSDLSTDHFVVIVGMGTDANGKYFQFFDSSTNNVSTGTSIYNKLYYNSTTGLISGKTQTGYGSGSPYAHDFIVTQIRKSK